MEFTTNTVIDPKLRVVTTEVYANAGKYGIVSTGSSRCSGPDKFDPEIGSQLATARALKDLARKIEKNARKVVAQRDATREAAEVARIKNLEERKARGEALRLRKQNREVSKLKSY